MQNFIQSDEMQYKWKALGVMFPKKNIIAEIIAVLFILLFVYTATSKLVDLKVTYREMNSQPFPNWMTPFLVWGIAFIEFAISGLLIFDRTKRIGLWSALIIMIIFSGYIGSILLDFFDRVPCACGGVIKQLGWVQHLYFNLFFVILGISSINNMRNKNRKSSKTK